MVQDELQRRLDGLAHEIAALRFELNPASGVADGLVGIERDADDNLVLFDPIAGIVPFHARWVPDSITGDIVVPTGNSLIRHVLEVPPGSSLELEPGATLVMV